MADAVIVPRKERPLSKGNREVRKPKTVKPKVIAAAPAMALHHAVAPQEIAPPPSTTERRSTARPTKGHLHENLSGTRPSAPEGLERSPIDRRPAFQAAPDRSRRAAGHQVLIIRTRARQPLDHRQDR
jgi:hypothetical protein